MKNIHFVFTLFFVFIISPSFAGEADIVDVQVFKNTDTSYNFEVAVSHADTGWDHYADKWEIVDENDEILGTRTLLHPHVNEQPFTRSLSGVEIPSSIKGVKVRAHDLVHGYGGTTLEVNLP